MNYRLLPRDDLRRLLHNHKRRAFPDYADNYRTDGVRFEDLMQSLKGLRHVPADLSFSQIMTAMRASL